MAGYKMQLCAFLVGVAAGEDGAAAGKGGSAPCLLLGGIEAGVFRSLVVAPFLDSCRRLTNLLCSDWSSTLGMRHSLFLLPVNQ